MKTKIQDYIVSSRSLEWKPLIEKGVTYEGIFIMPLHYDKVQQRHTTILLKFEPGASYPYHNHPGGEELFILEGEAIIEGASLQAGDYLYTPVNYRHGVTTTKGCTIFFRVPEEVEIL